MDAKQYWAFYRAHYESLVAGFAQITIEIYGEDAKLTERIFTQANDAAAEASQLQLEFRTWEARFIDNPDRELCYGEVSA